ncbi:MAG: zinc ABC transporter substrate-binding protein [Clostridia bacterium]|nr:zinc ABC transporter substrate-binding protein [Clostridia bacterium]
MKRITAFIILICLCLCSCSQKESTEISDNGRPIVVATIFPQYDFLRELAGNKADVYLLIPPGGESHSYEPSPSDIINISKSDLFVYAGGNVDLWAERLLEAEEMTATRTIALTDIVPLLCEEHEHEHEHDHEHDHEHGGLDEHHDHSEHEGHSEYDEHVWTSPENAIEICLALTEELCAADEANARFYRQNCKAYTDKLTQLDKAAREAVENAKHKTIVFADRFPIRYFTEEYGLSYIAAFPGCAAETEPGPQTLVRLIDTVREESIPVVFYREFSNGKVADLVCESTGAKKLLFHSCHNLSAEDFENGETYLSIMSRNISNLKEALN